VYDIAIDTEWGGRAAEWTASGAVGFATPFQHPLWLDCWYRTAGAALGVEPLLVSVARTSDGMPALVLPLIRRREGRLAVVESADLGITDYNAPLLGPALPEDGPAFRVLWDEIKARLDGCDIVRLGKLPPRLGARANPLAWLESARPTALNGNIVDLSRGWEAYRQGASNIRKEFQRCVRVIEREAVDARFVVARDAALAHHLLDTIEAAQRERVGVQGWDYLLDAPATRAFYRRLIDQGLASGYTLLAALMHNERDVIAALFCVRTGERLSLIRLAFTETPWLRLSPGSLMLWETMRHLSADGITAFDFTIGNYAYKQSFRPEQTPLLEVVEPLSPRGRIALGRAALAERAKELVRAVPQLERGVRRMMGREGKRE
jgi:CelD/BcsL family acetyltransferase involved in cellulose biosynthesis